MRTPYCTDDSLRWSPESPKTSDRTDFERDRARVLHSSALRRLGTKTQVIGFESDDFIRTRLTHSLEVAQVGRSLAKNLGADPDIVETACLSHDLGHPPYGHNGELALDEIASSFGGFEGNAQTLRILSRLEPKRFHDDGRPAGLNLTRATLDATIKYPWARFQGPLGEGSAKFGVYDDDVDVFTWAHGDHGRERPAETQMMDLSDDIAYSVHDFEDAVVRQAFRPGEHGVGSDDELSRIIDITRRWYGDRYSEDLLGSAAERIFAMKRWPGSFDGSFRDMASLKDFTSDLIGRFISSVTSASKAQANGEPLVRYLGNVVVPEETLAEILFLKGVAVHYVMAPREHEGQYFEQRTILFDLFDAINEDPRERLELPFLHLYNEAPSAEARLRVIVDQIASLTDQSARAWHARYCGMLRN